MKQKDVKVGKVYAVKVGERIAPVRLIGESAYGGWTGTNLWTRRDVRIRSAQKLRYEIQPDDLRRGDWQRQSDAEPRYRTYGEGSKFCARTGISIRFCRCPGCSEARYDGVPDFQEPPEDGENAD